MFKAAHAYTGSGSSEALYGERRSARPGEGDGQVIVAQAEREDRIARVVPVDDDSTAP